MGETLRKVYHYLLDENISLNSYLSALYDYHNYHYQGKGYRNIKLKDLVNPSMLYHIEIGFFNQVPFIPPLQALIFAYSASSNYLDELYQEVDKSPIWDYMDKVDIGKIEKRYFPYYIVNLCNQTSGLAVSVGFQYLVMQYIGFSAPGLNTDPAVRNYLTSFSIKDDSYRYLDIFGEIGYYNLKKTFMMIYENITQEKPILYPQAKRFCKDKGWDIDPAGDIIFNK